MVRSNDKKYEMEDEKLRHSHKVIEIFFYCGGMATIGFLLFVMYMYHHDVGVCESK